MAVWMVVLLVLAGSACHAAWEPSSMYAVGISETLLITPSWTQVGSDYVYSYALTNQTAVEEIVGFTLAFPAVVPVASLTAIVSPAGDWTAYVRTSTNRINWRLGEVSADALKPGQTFTFGFTSAFAPSDVKNMYASSQDSYGFSGMTYGPVPEPGSLMALAMGLAGLASIKLRRK